MNRHLLAMAIALHSGAALSQVTLCRFSSAGSLSFGAYDAMAPSARTSQANILVRCERDGGPANVAVTVGLGPGSNSPSTLGRKLVSPGSPTPLSYGLYQDSARSVHWGNVPGIDAATRTISIQNKGFETIPFIVYGGIPPYQDVYSGSYSDSIEVTVTP